MNIIIKLSILGFLLLSESCNSTKATSTETQSSKTTETIQAMDEKLLNEGFSIGTVKFSENSNCPYIIIDEKSKVQFDPINFDEEKFSDYRTDNFKIYYKAQYLKMKNRCDDGQPILVDKIKKREG